YDRINVVDNPDQLKQPFDGGAVNCRLLPRPLPAAIDFARAACAIADATPRARLDRGSLAGLRANLPPEARDAADFIIDDMDRFPAAELRVIRSDTYYGINTPDAISGRF